MTVNKITPKKNKAQAMVEFAIVLPILLLLLYGILEAGRLLFIYSTIVTASRQAVRYGSATGEGTTSTIPRYQDCAGIRLAAQRVDYLNAFENEDIIIYYDTGPTGTLTPFCGGDPVTSLPVSDTAFDPGTNNNYRLVVKIEGDFLPIVPKIVPFLSRSNTDTPKDPIRAQSARTVLVSVAIQVTVIPPTYVRSSPTATPTPNASPTFTPTNTPTDTPSPTPIFTDTPSITPSRTLSPTVTLSPTITRTPTITLTPSTTPTRVPQCDNLTWGNITLSGSTMTLSIRNPNPYAVRVQDVYVVWDSDRGHATGNDKTLILTNASLGGQFWTGNDDGPSVTLIPNPATAVLIPGGGATSTIIFTFHQSYERSDGSEEILINLSTPGCELNPIHEKN
jgi:Flp pilus assembly protein TadG